MQPTVAATLTLRQRAGRLSGRASVLALSAVFTGAFALWIRPLRDLAAHTFRADYFSHYGFALWNGSWYGGEYMLTYSILFPPLSALLSPELAGVLSAIVCAYFFDRIVRDRWGDQARLASFWFAALGSLALLANGWLPFALGTAFALGALRALQLRRPALAVAAALGSALASPVAAVLLALVVGAGGLAHGRARLRPVALVAVATLVPTALLALVFPEGGRFPFWFSAYWPLALTCGAGLLAIRGMREERELRAVLIGYLAFGTLAWLVPNPVGGNVTRLGSLFAGPVLAAVVLSRPARAPAGRGARRAHRGARLAGRDADPRHLPEPRRPVHRQGLLRAALGLAHAPRRRARAARGALHLQPLGDGLPGAALRARAGLAAAGRRIAKSPLLRRSPHEPALRRWLRENGVRWVALPTRASTTRPSRRPRSCAARRRTCGCSAVAGPLADLRGAGHRPDARAGGGRAWAPPATRARVLHARRPTSGRLRRARARDALLAARDAARAALARRATGRSFAPLSRAASAS